ANLRMWVDGPNRRPDEVDPDVRRFVGEMQRRALELQIPVWDDAEEELLVLDVASRLDDLHVLTLVLVGAEDVADMHEIAGQLVAAVGGVGQAKSTGAAPVA